MSKLAVLMTCHNRRDKTVMCLRSLAAAAAHAPVVSYHVYLVDDASTDGTTAAVEQLGMPLTVVRGSGDLYWNRGMVRAWQTATEHEDAFDGFLLLNDDTSLDESALLDLLTVSHQYDNRAIVVGAVRDPYSGALTYGGVLRASRWHPGRVRSLPISDKSQLADTFNANCVYVTAAVFEAVGMLDPTFQHAMGDFDYGYRAIRRGFHVVVAPGTVGTCARNPVAGSWRDPALPVKRRLMLLESPKGLPRREWREFLRRHGAPLPTLLAWMPALRVLRSGAFINTGRERPT